MGDSSISKTNFDEQFVCECEEQVRTACDGLPFYEEYEGKQYCVLHFPSSEKKDAFKIKLDEKLKANDFNFRGVWFPDEISFANIRFRNKVDFSFSTFNERAFFTSTIFYADVSFRFATFNKELFFDSSVKFKSEAGFNSARFYSHTSFQNAIFEYSANFEDTIFNGDTKFTYTEFREDVTFRAAIFKEQVSFSVVTFRKGINFISAKFGADTEFSHAKFCVVGDKGDTVFSSAQFSGKADFKFSKFNGNADFGSTQFNSVADFRFATFIASLSCLSANFKDYVKFAKGSDEQGFAHTSSLNLQHARIEKSEQFSFHTLRLKPHWFVNIDARKFELTNVEWNNNIYEEIEELKKMKVLAYHRLLARACRQLATNEEENHRYEEASNLRYMAMESRRLEHWWGFAPLTMHWWYWFASGYGERVVRAFFVLLSIWFLSALLYTQVGFVRWEPKISNEQEAATSKRDDVGQPLSFKRAMTYSLSVMSLQKPEPKPATNAAHAVVILETILGPLQAALLTLAIRRRFMR